MISLNKDYSIQKEKLQDWPNDHKEPHSPGATQIHPEAADDGEDDHPGGDFYGENVVQRVDSHP